MPSVDWALQERTDEGTVRLKKDLGAAHDTAPESQERHEELV